MKNLIKINDPSLIVYGVAILYSFYLIFIIFVSIFVIIVYLYMNAFVILSGEYICNLKRK